VQYPISFAMNLAIPTDKVIGAKQVYCASATSAVQPVDCASTKVTGGKGDEPDADKHQVSCTE